MAAYRAVSMNFWTDSKVIDDFTPEDKLFYLYLITNPHTNLCGCYEISMKQIVDEVGYKRNAIENLIEKFQSAHDIIRYSKDTKEILILNWSKYNWTSSEKFRKPLLKHIEKVKNNYFREYLLNLFNGIHTVSIPYQYRIDTNCTDTKCIDTTVSVPVSDTDTTITNKMNNNDNNENNVTMTNNDNNVTMRNNATREQNDLETKVSMCVLNARTKEEIVARWNELEFFGITPIRGIEGKRLEAVRARMKQYGEDCFFDAIDRIRESGFLQGNNNRGWSIKFDWLIKPNNFTKVIEGNYNDNKNRPINQTAQELNDFYEMSSNWAESEE